MNLMQCNKKHFYDGEKFSVCPYCTGATGNFSAMNGTDVDLVLKPSASEVPVQYEPTVILEDEINS